MLTFVVTVGQHKFFYVAMVLNNWQEYFLSLISWHQPTSLKLQAVFISTSCCRLSLSCAYQMASQLWLIGKETEILVRGIPYRSKWIYSRTVEVIKVTLAVLLTELALALSNWTNIGSLTNRTSTGFGLAELVLAVLLTELTLAVWLIELKL